MIPISKQDIAFTEAAQAIKHLWRHRNYKLNLFGREIKEIKLGKLTMQLEHEIPGLVLDVIDQLWPEPRPKPLLTHKKRTANGWHLIFTLPPGVSYKEVSQRRDYFSDACRSLVSLVKEGGYLHMNICTGQLKSYYPYEWDPVPYLKNMVLPVPIGHTPAGLVVVDLAALPHMRIGGTTFTGKSNFLHALFISLAMLPDTILAVIDLALLEFSYSKRHAAFASDAETARRLLAALEHEMHRRRRVLDRAGVENIQKYHGLHGRDSLPYIVLLIDEFAFMFPDGTPDKEEKEMRKQCQAMCSNLAALARKVGIHLVIAMQRPDHKILPGQLKANLPGALSFKTIDRVNSEIILDNGDAADLPNIQGRAIWQVGNQQSEVQVMHLPLKKAKKILTGLEHEEVNVWDAFGITTKRLPPG